MCVMSLTSCKRALTEPWPPDAARTYDDIWSFYKYCEGSVNSIYSQCIIRSYPYDVWAGGNDSYGNIATATDEAEHSLASGSVQKFTNGSWSPTNTPNMVYGGPWASKQLLSPWVNSYKGIRMANIALENLDGSALIDDLDDPTRRYALTWAKGQAYFWRAFLEFDLLRHYGPFIITTETEELDGDVYRGRNTMEECMAQIIKDCNSAIDSLPTLWTEEDWHRANKTAAQALKARALLYYASPLYQGKFEEFGLEKGATGEVQRWKDAADACRVAVNDNDFYRMEKVTVFKRPYSEPGTYNYVVYQAANLENTELIFGSAKTTSLANNWEVMSMPAGIDGCNGWTNPTQEMVDAFEVVTGTGANRKAVPFDWNNPAHAADPYANRDPRFYNDILYNGTLWGAASSKAYYIDFYEAATIDGKNYPGGKHRDYTLKECTKTGYCMRKFLTEAFYANVSGQYTTLSRTRNEFRITELILNYAEALNEAYGPEVADPNGFLRDFGFGEGICTAKACIDAVRARVNMPAVASGMTKEEMRECIHHERRIELCFEGHRFFDLRRWKEGEKLGEAVHGIKVIPTEFKGNRPSAYRYEVEKVEDRTWKRCYYWWPIPNEELVKYANGALKQNPEW